MILKWRQTLGNQKSESLPIRSERSIRLEAHQRTTIVADFFCGSGTTGAVAERLGRRWIMADLRRFAIHTSC
jgi:DNA modification methylase